MIRFIDANIFIEACLNYEMDLFIDSLNEEDYCTSVLVLSEVFHKLQIRKVTTAFEYVRSIMGAIRVYDTTKDDLFNAIKNPLPININDKIHIAVMKRNNIITIVSNDADFDKEKTITREALNRND